MTAPTAREKYFFIGPLRSTNLPTCRSRNRPSNCETVGCSEKDTLHRWAALWASYIALMWGRMHVEPRSLKGLITLLTNLLGGPYRDRDGHEGDWSSPTNLRKKVGSSLSILVPMEFYCHISSILKLRDDEEWGLMWWHRYRPDN